MAVHLPKGTRDLLPETMNRRLRVVDTLIAQTQANLSRGYGIEREAYVTSTLDLCLGGGSYRYGRYGGTGWTYCHRPTTRYKAKPVTIDRAAEQRKLAELKQTRARLLKEAKPGDIGWNFTKFLVDGAGNVVERFEPQVTPEEIEPRVKELLG